MYKRICILTSAHPVFDVRIFYREAITLAKAGYDVTLIARHNKKEIVDEVKIVPLPKPRNGFERMTKIVWKLFRLALKERADVYHFHDPELLFPCLFLKIFNRAKIIYDVHEDFPSAVKIRHWMPPVFRKLVAPVVDIYQKLFSICVDYIITADDNIKKSFFLCPPKKITIFNFPKLEYFKELSERRDPNLIIHSGGLTKERGGDIIIDSIRQVKQKFPSIKLLLIGNICPPYEKYIHDKIRRYKLTKNVFLHKMTSQKNVIQYLKKASIGLSLLQPVEKFKKNIPQKIFEYMASGIPFVISELPPTMSFVKQCRCAIVVDPTNSHQVARAIIYLLSHKSEAKKMGENGRKAVLEKYNWENEGKKLLKIYDELLKRKR